MVHRLALQSRGLHVLIPLVDRIKYVHSLKLVVLDLPIQNVVTNDMVSIDVIGAVLFKIGDPYKASYNVDDVITSFTKVAQATLRLHMGSYDLDGLLENIEDFNLRVSGDIGSSTANWGIWSTRFEIYDMKLPPRIESAYSRKMFATLTSEDVKAAEMKLAERRKGRQFLNQKNADMSRKAKIKGLFL